MAAIGDTVTDLLGGSLTTLVIIIPILLFLLFVTVLVVWFFMKKKWNLKIEFKMVRSDGRIIIPEWGKGRFDRDAGIIWVKRKKMKPEGIKATDIRKYLQGADTITLIGNPGNWKIVIPDSFHTVIDEETGEEAAVMEIKTDMKEDKPWAIAFERMIGETFTIQSFFSEYGQYLGWGFIMMITVIANFVGFSLVLDKIAGN